MPQRLERLERERKQEEFPDVDTTEVTGEKLRNVQEHYAAIVQALLSFLQTRKATTLKAFCRYLEGKQSDLCRSKQFYIFWMLLHRQQVMHFNADLVQSDSVYALIPERCSRLETMKVTEVGGLRTQQVLLNVLENRSIKVRCRKATSNNTFSERPYSWEDSNKWSGGEMWSKNMALFLGCLNYLSEKRCHIRKAKYNTRVVIADNPFGKASSDHVLSPVFFIAEKLGFQIIALTAHQEGSFIRKYFSIVYSCRFAEMTNKQGKVLLPEKEIKTAFFEQHHPESLARLEEYEQLGLF